jgi:hypothetical protein
MTINVGDWVKYLNGETIYEVTDTKEMSIGIVYATCVPLFGKFALYDNHEAESLWIQNLTVVSKSKLHKLYKKRLDELQLILNFIKDNV